MGWHLEIGIVAGVIQICATVPYIVSILRGTTRPNLISWTLWTTTVLITLVAQISIGVSSSAFLLIGALLCNVGIVFLCVLGYGYKKFGRIDVITLIFAMAAIGGWFISANPLVAMVFAVAADCIAYAPTLLKMYRDPASEQMLYWGALVLADVLAFISVTSFTISSIIFPVAYGIMNVSGCVLLIFGRKTLVKNPLSSHF